MSDWRTQLGFKDPEDKLKIYYSMEAFVKTRVLVREHSKEIAWDMVVTKYKNGYKVHDILVYPQNVDPAFVHVDVATAYPLWRGNLDPFEGRRLNGQGHSHVDMGVFKSGTDEAHQYDEITKIKEGFFLYQIWNKKNEVSSYFYDIDNKIYYETKDIEIEVENMNDFIADSFEKIGGRSIGSE